VIYGNAVSLFPDIAMIRFAFMIYTRGNLEDGNVSRLYLCNRGK